MVGVSFRFQQDRNIRIWKYPLLKELIDETRERFKDYPLSDEEKKRYYLDYKFKIFLAKTWLSMGNNNYVTNTEYKAICPYCSNNNLWDSDFVIRETGPIVASWYDSSAVHSVVNVYYVRCCEKCFKRRKRIDRIRNLMFLIPLCHFILIILLYGLSKISVLHVFANLLLLFAYILIPLSILSVITSFFVYPLYNYFSRHKRVVSKDEAQRHNALFSYPINKSSINQDILDPFRFGKVDMERFEKEAGLRKNPHFYSS